MAAGCGPKPGREKVATMPDTHTLLFHTFLPQRLVLEGKRERRNNIALFRAVARIAKLADKTNIFSLQFCVHFAQNLHLIVDKK